MQSSGVLLAARLKQTDVAGAESNVQVFGVECGLSRVQAASVGRLLHNIDVSRWHYFKHPFIDRENT
jgi:hypothetical protein